MIKLLISDLDDTLYSWIGFFVPAFYDMVEELSNITEIPGEELLQEFKGVHQAAGSAEFPYATLQLPSIKNLYCDYNKEKVLEILNSAFHRFNSTRKQKLQLYPCVKEVLEFLKNHNITVVGYTESAEENGYYRLQKLGIDQYFREVFVSNSKYERPNCYPSSSKTKVVYGKKPNPRLLKQICKNENISEKEAIYLGDSLTKDIYMAKQAGITSVWCNYPVDNSELYKKLVAISHWKEEDFLYEEKLKNDWIKSGYTPDYSIQSFDEIIKIISTINGINL
ncbi:MAG: putative hydrolase superfamily [Bacillota bacterium]|jgi:phosphoglycolate phosphatase|nr:putative hydrolase superfamily [Bacillota bacterium]